MGDTPASCDGCTGCAMRCTEGVRISESEYSRIVEFLQKLHPRLVTKILNQSKQQYWFEEITYEACLFLDTNTRQCLIYPVRPLVCRLFGRVKHLPCPINLIEPDVDAGSAIQFYTSQRLLTFQEWMVEFNIFNFEDLLGTAAEMTVFEI